jgi:hypothetical protein
VVLSAVAQRVIVTNITNGNVKPAEILSRLGAQFGNETALKDPGVCLEYVVYKRPDRG